MGLLQDAVVTVTLTTGETIAGEVIEDRMDALVVGSTITIHPDDIHSIVFGKESK